MHRYAVSYRTLALINSEIEVPEPEADKVRKQLRENGAERQPAVFGRDWGWTDCVKTVVIEADSYSLAANGSAHFYRIAYGSTNPGVLVYSVTSPVTIGIEGDGGVTEPAWDPKTSAFPPGTFDIPKRTLVPLTFDELRTLRNWLSMLDPDKKCATDSKLDSWLRQYQRDLEVK